MKKTINKIIFLGIFVSQIFGISSCQWFSENGNDEIIERHRFIHVLADIHVADAILSHKNLNDRDLKDTTGKKSYYNSIFKKYQITEYKFAKSVEYYSKNPQKYYEIYTEVIDELNKKRVSLDTINAPSEISSKPNSVGDSLLRRSAKKHFKKIGNK